MARRQLGRQARGLAASGLGGVLGFGAGPARGVAALVGGRAVAAQRLDAGLRRRRGAGSLVALVLEWSQLLVELGAAVALELRQLGLELGDPLAVVGAGRRPRPRRARRQLARGARRALDRVAGRRAPVEAQLDALGRRARAANTRRASASRCSVRAASACSAASRRAATSASACAASSRRARARRGAGLGRGELGAAGAQRVARQLPARLERSGARGARAARRPRPGA